MLTQWRPAAARTARMCDPMYPAPPVTRTDAAISVEHAAQPRRPVAGYRLEPDDALVGALRVLALAHDPGLERSLAAEDLSVANPLQVRDAKRSEERRVGKESMSRWS